MLHSSVRNLSLVSGVRAAARLAPALLIVLAFVFASMASAQTAGDWTWMGGSDTNNQPGVYGTLGTPAPANIPGARDSAATWTDSSGNFWLFGSYGFDTNSMVGYLNDLWEFNPSKNEWAWMGGSDSIGQPGVYGTLGVPAAGNNPGGRDNAATWTDSNGNLWLFGGELDVNSLDSPSVNYLNDLWEFNPSTKEWAWMSGSSTAGTGVCFIPGDYIATYCSQPGVYGTLGVPAAANTPGGRTGASSWTDSSGHLWLFGGFDIGPSSAYYGEFVNDLWEFDPSKNEWAWRGGSSAGKPLCNVFTGYCGQPGVYGTLGAPAAGNIPGSRYGASTRTDSSGNLWLFGGNGYDVNGNGGYLNDLWEFNPATNEWTWRSGSSAAGQFGVYGTLGTPAAGNIPGGRFTASSWIDSSGRLWLFGGQGLAAGNTFGYFNDLWIFDPSTTEWAWMGGSNSINERGVYGTLGTPAVGNVPGGRFGASSWTDSSGHLWLFGGDGTGSLDVSGFLNDLWEYQPAGTNPTTIPAVMISPAPGLGTVLGTNDVTFHWTAGTGVTLYQLNLGTIAPGSSSLFTSGGISATSVVVPSLPANGVKVYARLFSKISGSWQYNDYVYTEQSPPTPATLTTPTPGLGTVLGTSYVTFQWTATSGLYQLNLGINGPGSSSLFTTGKTGATSVAVPSLPANGVTVYARLFTYINGAWQYNDYVYTESGAPTLATLTTPTPGLGTVLGTKNVTFEWTAGGGVSLHQLNLGINGPGSSSLFTTGETAQPGVVLPSLPADGVTVYARLYSKIDGAWQHNDYVYTESGAPTLATLTTPTPGLGTVLGTRNVTFKWTAGAGVILYQLDLGTIAPGSSSLFSSGGIFANSVNVPTLPAHGAKVYARLWSKIDGAWQHNDYVYTEQ